MTHRRVPITFTYQKSGTKPPIYVAGTFSDPAWKPQEMDVSVDQHGEHVFTKEVMVDDGSEIQYKFRIGPGDWWALDENADKITDNGGNINNVLRVSTNKSQKDTTKDSNIAFDNLKGSAESNRAQNLEFAETAAEVADSACTMDVDAPEAEVPEEEAGRLGIRRLSLTPIGEVAQTAMDVADVAAKLDADGYDISDDDEDDDGSLCPVFSYECLSRPGHEGKVSDTPDSYVDQHTDKTLPMLDDSSDESEVDLDDPRLEPFPSSDRDSIIAVVRRLSTTVDADRTLVEGIPPSFIVDSYQGNEITSHPEEFGSKKVATGILSSRDQTRPPVANKSLSSSVGSTSIPNSSLHCIAEDDESDHHDEPEGVATLFGEQPGSDEKSPFAPKSLTDDDDEGIIMNTAFKRGLRYKTRGSTESPAPQSPNSSLVNISPATEPAPNNPVLVRDSERKTPVEEDQHPTVAVENTTVYAPTAPVYPSPSSDKNGLLNIGKSKTTSTVVDTGSQTHLRKKTANPLTTILPSVQAKNDVNQAGNWLKTFSQVVFVKWIGGFASWLCSRPHRV
ncbi:hypothetical protein F5B20DRAFT_582366 [Whalleya microplaca]|nr:hypothetical protein F5B20DRAFT_582366 [Whalleya microplaca]